VSVLALCGSLFVSIWAAARSLVAAEQYKTSRAHSYLRVHSSEEEGTDDDDYDYDGDL
jgi:hypothetical protein